MRIATGSSRMTDARAAGRPRIVPRKLLGSGAVWALLLLASALYLVPWAWLVSSSLKAPQQIVKLPPTWIPDPVMWGNYIGGVTRIKFFLYLRNTLIISSVTVVGTLISCSLVAYGIALIDWPLRGPLFVLILATMMVPFQVTMIPLYVLFSKIHWINTFYPLTVPAFLGNAFFIFLLRQFFMTLPGELLDAARLDGCSSFGIYRRIAMPLAKPAIATLVAFSFIWTYNDFQGPLIYLIDNKLWTLALGLRGFASQYGDFTNNLGALMAASTLYTLPMIVLFFVAQKALIQGIVTSGFK